MPVHTIKISDWGVLYYHFQGYCTSAETVKATQDATRDYPQGQLLTVFDLLEGELDIEQMDVNQIIKENNRLFDRGINTTHAAILTHSQSLKVFLNAFELIMGNVPTKIKTFSNLTDGLAWLGIAQHEREILDLLKEFRK